MDPKELRGLYEAYAEVYAPQEIEENSRTARDPEGSGRERTRSKQPDPSKPGFTGIGNMSIDQIRKMSARIEKEKNQNEEVEIDEAEIMKFQKEKGAIEARMDSNKRRRSKTSPYYTAPTRGAHGADYRRRHNIAPTRLRSGSLPEEYEVDIFDVVLEFLQAEGFVETLEEAQWLMANELDAEMIDAILDEAEKPFPHEKVKAKQLALRSQGGNALDRRMRMGAAVRRAKEAEKTGGSQRHAGAGWYHGR